MPAEVVNRTMLPDRGREVITIMDDFGTEYQVYIPVTVDAATRQARIDAAVAQQTNNQAALEAYATAHNLDLSEQKTAGLAKKQLAQGA